MNKFNNTQRNKAVASAIWSVKAEGLKPSKSTIDNLNQYAQGKITVTEMRQNTSRDVKKITSS